MFSIVAAALAAAAGGLYWVALWQRDRQIGARLGQYGPIIWKYSYENALPAELVRDVIRAESGGDPRAVSNRNARGLMQITPVTVEEVRRLWHVDEGDLFDPNYNIEIGTAYLRILIDKFDGDVYLALAAYHMGPTRLLKAQKRYPDMSARELVARIAPASTVRYCRRILGNHDLRLPSESSE